MKRRQSGESGPYEESLGADEEGQEEYLEPLGYRENHLGIG